MFAQPFQHIAAKLWRCHGAARNFAAAQYKAHVPPGAYAYFLALRPEHIHIRIVKKLLWKKLSKPHKGVSFRVRHLHVLRIAT